MNKILLYVYLTFVVLPCFAQNDVDTIIGAIDLVNCMDHSDLLPTESMRLSARSSTDDNSVSIPEVCYQSPEAISFQRFGEYEMGEYTGNANVNIPLYEIDCRDLKFPITLSYQGGGIKVADEATWVGLGWNMSIVGCINRIPSGHPDVLYRNPSSITEEDYICQIENEQNNYITNSLQNPVSHNLLYDSHVGLCEKDLFSLNLNGKSCLFFINPSNNNIEFIGNNEELYSIEKVANSWHVKDCMGYEYIFSEIEYAYSSVGNYESTWNISEIISPTGAHAKFRYSSLCYLSFIPKATQRYEMCSHTTVLAYLSGYPTPSFPSTGVNTYFSRDNLTLTKKYLCAIVTDADSVVFSVSDREDLQGSKKMDSMAVYSQLTNKLIKRWNFVYSYFLANDQGNCYIDSSLPTYTKRLKLISVQNPINPDSNERYTFEYIEDFGLPCKTSYATDIWGFYNGTNNTDFIPSTSYCFMGTQVDSIFQPKIRNYQGANRFASAKYSNQCSLKKLTYPSKGYTEFQYEPHSFISVPAYPDAQSEYTNVRKFQCWDSNFSGSTLPPPYVVDIELTTHTKGQLRAEFTKMTSSSITLNRMKTSGAYVLLQQTHVSTPISYTLSLSSVNTSDIYGKNEYELSTYVDLEPGHYKLVAYLSDDLGNNPGCNVHGIIDIRSTVNAPTFFQSIGGGIRIKSIKNYDHDGSLKENTTYEYVDNNGVTSGKLLLPASLGEYCELFGVGAPVPEDHPVNYYPHESGGVIFQVLRLNSTPYGIPAITSATTKGIVGYSRVVSKKGNSINVSEFTNENACAKYSNECTQKYMSRNMYFNENLSNGNLLKRTIMNTNGDTLSVTRNIYTTLSSHYFKNNLAIEDVYIVKYMNSYFSTTILESMLRVPQYIINVYSLPYKWQALNSTEVNSYSEGVGTNSLRTVFTYDTINSQNHAVVTKQESSSINGINYITKYDYPTTLTDSASNKMVKMHMLNVVVGESYYENGTLIRKKFAVYEKKGAYYVPGIMQYAFNGGILEGRILYRYDNYCNPIEIVKDSCDKVCYLWAYKSLYPVAKVEGLTYSELTSHVPIYLISTLANTTNTTQVENCLNIIRRNLAGVKCLVTTYTFEPLIGVTKITAPNGYSTTYHYDSSNRLNEIIGNDGNTIKKYYYNYKQ